MQIIKTKNWRIPAYYASAIINDDYTGLNDEEEKILNNFLKNEIRGTLTLENMEQEPFFSWYNDITNLGSDVLDFIELIYK